MYVKFKSTLTGVLTLYVYFIGESKSYLIYIYMLMGEPTPHLFIIYYGYLLPIHLCYSLFLLSLLLAGVE